MQDDVLHFTAFPTIQFYDGRGANRPWLQEMPDPMTQVTWGGWLEIHPDTADRLGIKSGDMLRVKSPYGEIEVPALPIFTVPSDTAAMPLGQGHSLYGRFAGGLPANPLLLFPPNTDPAGGLARPPHRSGSDQNRTERAHRPHRRPLVPGKPRTDSAHGLRGLPAGRKPGRPTGTRFAIAGRARSEKKIFIRPTRTWITAGAWWWIWTAASAAAPA